MKILHDFLFTRTPQEPEGVPEGGHQAAKGSPGTAPALAALGGPLGDPGTPSRRLFAYKFTLDLKIEEPPSKFLETHLSAAGIENPSSGDRSLCFGTLPGWGSAPGAIYIDGDASMMQIGRAHV